MEIIPSQTIINYNCLNINTLEKSNLFFVFNSNKKRKINKNEINTNSLNIINLKLGFSDDMIIKLNNKSYNLSRIFLFCFDYLFNLHNLNNINDINDINDINNDSINDDIKYIKINFDKLKKLSFIQRLSINNIELLTINDENIYVFYLNDDDLDDNNYNTLIKIGFIKDIKIQF